MDMANDLIVVRRRGQIIGHICWNGDASYSATALNPKTGETKWLGLFGQRNAGGMVSQNYDDAMKAVKKYKWQEEAPAQTFTTAGGISVSIGEPEPRPRKGGRKS